MLKEKEGEGSSGTEECTEIFTVATTLERFVIFHVVKEIVGFILYMHQQIPAILQGISVEFDSMHIECKQLKLVLTEKEVKASTRRQQNGRMREVKNGIRRLEKLMTSFSKLQIAFQMMLNESFPENAAEDYTKSSRVAEALARKAIRALISSGAGSVSYGGPTKLFLLVKAPATFNLPLHFLPKRDFRYSKKIVPFRLRIACIAQDHDMAVSGLSSFGRLHGSTSNDLIWFQCKHTIKGLAMKHPSQDE